MDKDVLPILNKKALVLLQVYQQDTIKNIPYLQASNDTYQLALEVIQLQRQGLLAAGSKTQLSETVIPIYEGALQALLAKDQGQLSPTVLNQAFQLCESSKAILLLESINEQTTKGFAGIPDSLLAQERSLKNELLFYQKKVREEKAKGAKAVQEKIVSMEETFFQYRRQHQELIADLEKNYPRYHQLKYATHLASIAQVQAKLPSKQSAVVEYFVGKENHYFFYIDKTNAQMVVKLGLWLDGQGFFKSEDGLLVFFLLIPTIGSHYGHCGVYSK